MNLPKQPPAYTENVLSGSVEEGAWVPPHYLDEILSNAADVLERTCILERRLISLNDRLLGPNAYLAATADEPPIGSVNRMGYFLGAINHRLDRVFAELEKLERL